MRPRDRAQNRIRVAIVSAFLVLMQLDGLAQTPVDSFGALAGVLNAGDQVRVVFADGRRTQSKVARLDSSTLELQPPSKRLFRRQRPAQSVAESSVDTVLLVDSVANGLLVGFVAAYCSVVLGCMATDSNECPYAAVFAGPILGLAGAGIGGWIDGRKNEVVFRAAPPRQPTKPVTVMPFWRMNEKGVSLHFSF